jgi:hypothetical protein
MADQEIIFTVEDAPEGGYTARALGYAIFTQGEPLKNCVKWCETRSTVILRKRTSPGSSRFIW